MDENKEQEISPNTIQIEDERFGTLVAKKLSNGLVVMATSEHPYTMEDGDEISPNPALSHVLVSEPSEKMLERSEMWMA